MHRFLLTLLYWKIDLAGGVEQVRMALLNGEIPGELLDGIKNETHCFDLFDEETPFLQDPSAYRDKESEKKSAGSLFAELAVATNIAHFHHGDDENLRLCLPCATIGLLRVIPWTQSGGSGLTPSVHNAPPIMVMAIGESLAVTLGLNLVPLDVEAGEVKWSGHFKPTNPTGRIPYLEAFTWNPRRILLPSTQRGNCWYCGGRNVPTVGKIVFMKNEETNQRKDKRLFEWQDPAAFYAPYDTSKKYDKIQNAPYKTKKSHQENSSAYNRDLPDPTKDHLPAVFTQNNEHQSWLLVVPCTNPLNNKTFDHRQEELTNLEPIMFRDSLPSAPQTIRQGLNGWENPERYERKGIERFLKTSVSLLSHDDWIMLFNAAYMKMHESPAAFDVFSGLYWGLLGNHVTGLPKRDIAWLMLKLMSVVPASARILHIDAHYLPYLSLPKRQINERNRISIYPVSFPHGRRLETAIHEVLINNMRKRKPESVDWVGLCHSFELLLK